MENNSSSYIWHPFTQMKTAAPPIHIKKAKDCTLYDEGGNTYIDAISSWWVNIHGHANKTIADRVAQQANELEHVIFAGFTHTPAIRLSEQLISILPEHFAKVFFSDDGSTCVEVAIKMAIQYWHNNGFANKKKIIALEGAYHGDTFGAMSIGERGPFNEPFHPLLFEVVHIPLPNEKNIESVKKIFIDLADNNDVAAFIFEPLVQGAGGMRMYKASFLDELISLANQKNIVCIADEVMTGFGRTGKNFAIEYLQCKPDIICLSKGITGGFLPLGVTVCSQKIFDAFYHNDNSKTFYHGHSYTGNPLSCAAANASIALLVHKDCQQNIARITSSHAQFSSAIQNHPFVANLRQQGTILAFELNTTEQSSYFNHIRDMAYNFYMSHGVLLRPLGNTIYIMPPYCITNEELDKIYSVIRHSIDHFSTI